MHFGSTDEAGTCTVNDNVLVSIEERGDLSVGVQRPLKAALQIVKVDSEACGTPLLFRAVNTRAGSYTLV